MPHTRPTGQENKHPPKKNPLEQGESRKHAPQQGPDVIPRTPPKIEAPSKK